jgi:diadenosine tetraphosphate (Ap4A) HIT family hydrolase
LAETKLSFAFLDNFPVSKGHTLVIPKRHVVSLWEMTTEEYTDAFALVRQVKDVLQEQFQPEGFNVGVNCGHAAGQSVFHAHIHLIPRTPEMYQIREAVYATSFPAKVTTRSWIITLLLFMRLSRRD